MAGDRAFVGNRFAGDGAYVVDVSQPDAPVWVGTLDFHRYEGHVAAGENVGYLAGSRIEMLDAEDPLSTKALGSYSSGFGETRDVQVAGDLLYVLAQGGDTASVLQVVDLGPCRACPWDFDLDGTVNPFDSNFVIARFGCDVGTGDENCDRADVDGNFVVDPFDTNVVMAHFGPCP